MLRQIVDISCLIHKMLRYAQKPMERAEQAHPNHLFGLFSLGFQAKRDAMYEIRQARLSDWPMIQAFIDRCYGSGAPFKQQARWLWQFRNTPYPPEEGDLVPVWIAVKDGVVAGQLALQPGVLNLAGDALPIGWIVDVMIDEAHRGQGLGHRIHDAIVASGRTLVTLTMAPATRKIAEKTGACITLGPVYQMVRVRRLSGRTLAVLLERIGSTRPRWQSPIRLFNRLQVGPWLIAAALSAGLGLARLFRNAAATNAKWTPVSQVRSTDIDRMSALLESKAMTAFDRDTRFFRWRFEDAPDLDYRFAELSEGDQVSALVVMRRPHPAELDVGTLTEILCDPNDERSIGDAVGHAVQTLANDCEAIIAGAAHPAHVAALRRHGFVTVRTHRPTIVSRDRALLDRIAAYSGPWHMSKADHDWDQIHPADH